MKYMPLYIKQQITDIAIGMHMSKGVLSLYRLTDIDLIRNKHLMANSDHDCCLTLYRTLNRCFMSNIAQFGQVFLGEKNTLFIRQSET